MVQGCGARFSLGESWRPALLSFANQVGGASSETLCAIFLGEDGAVQSVQHTPPGSADALYFPLRSLVEQALFSRSGAIILAHNHPSGCVQPSKADIEQTRLLARTLLPLGIDIEDHIIITREAHFSFREAGML